MGSPTLRFFRGILAAAIAGGALPAGSQENPLWQCQIEEAPAWVLRVRGTWYVDSFESEALVPAQGLPEGWSRVACADAKDLKAAISIVFPDGHVEHRNCGTPTSCTDPIVPRPAVAKSSETLCALDAVRRVLERGARSPQWRDAIPRSTLSLAESVGCASPKGAKIDALLANLQSGEFSIELELLDEPGPPRRSSMKGRHSGISSTYQMPPLPAGLYVARLLDPENIDEPTGAQAWILLVPGSECETIADTFNRAREIWRNWEDPQDRRLADRAALMHLRQGLSTSDQSGR